MVDGHAHVEVDTAPPLGTIIALCNLLDFYVLGKYSELPKGSTKKSALMIFIELSEPQPLVVRWRRST